ncbi:MAG: hypothetical protein CW338_04445 [Clostridiales bacterium]|nr:hypothetical protein [Clostridiales bacterium]
MTSYSFKEAPFHVFGAPRFYKYGTMDRFPRDLAERMFPGVVGWHLDVRSPGARLAFRTDADEIRFDIEYESISVDTGMSLYSAQSGDVFIGRGGEARYLGQIVPPDLYSTPRAEGTFRQINPEGKMQEIIVFLPRNEKITGMTVSLPDDARVLPPEPYTWPVPVLYYGSSITEGAHAGKPSNAYNALLSRWLDCDFINFGVSGSARGELFVADYLNTFEKSVFVMDYDYNAPDEEHLRRTHRPFFERIREHDPGLPVIIISGPRVDRNADAGRRAIIRETYDRAVAAGDRHVWFIDGGDFFGEEDRAACTADCIHPNDLGMYRMARAIRPVLLEALRDSVKTSPDL